LPFLKSQEIIHNYLYWQWLVFLVSGTRSENEKKVVLGNNDEDASNEFLKFVTKILITVVEYIMRSLR